MSSELSSRSVGKLLRGLSEQLPNHVFKPTAGVVPSLRCGARRLGTVLGDMRTVALGLVMVLTVAACGDTADCDFCGRWESHEARTLQEMEQSRVLSEAQKQIYRNGFFGRLVVETTATQTRAFFPDERPDSRPWATWEVVERSGNTYVTRFKDPESGEWSVKSVRLQDDCYRVEQPELGFGEWFCRAPG